MRMALSIVEHGTMEDSDAATATYIGQMALCTRGIGHLIRLITMAE